MALPDGMARRSDGALWNPRPRPDLTNFSRRAYLAGYSDGFHGYRFGSGDDGSFGAFSDYRVGFDDGRADGAEGAGEWRIEWWEISGVHTGWRIVRGHGQQKEFGQGFAFDRYKPGDFERQEAAAKRWCEQLNSGEIEAEG
ncbi:MAG: hypothetical protein WA975_18050 [Mesorhizobium sp.]